MYKKKADGTGRLDGSTGEGIEVPETAPPALSAATPETNTLGERPQLIQADKKPRPRNDSLGPLTVSTASENTPTPPAVRADNAKNIAESSQTDPETLKQMAYDKPGLLTSAALIANPNTPDEAAKHLAENDTHGLNDTPSTVLQHIYQRRLREQKRFIKILPTGVPVDYGNKLPGLTYMNEELGRCERCDSRYCHSGCFAGQPGYFYVSGRGHLKTHEVLKQIGEWEKRGIKWGPHSATARVEMRCFDENCTQCNINLV